MKHFKFIANIDVTAALAEIEANDYLFGPHTERPEESPPLREGKSIHLRIHDKHTKTADISDDMGAKELADKILGAADTKNMERLPECAKLIKLAASMISGGEIGRSYIAKMVPGGKIYPHIDPGKYFTIHDRYHIVIKTNKGVSFSCGGKDDTETVRFEQGQLWVFNNKIVHWAENAGDTDRIHIIMDYRNDTVQFN